jgi:hypothetical protein
MEPVLVNQSEQKIIHQKNGIVIKLLDKNKYELSFEIENNNIILKKLINFQLMRIIYEVNKDIFDDFSLDIYSRGCGVVTDPESVALGNVADDSDNEADIYLSFKHFFEDLGFQKRYNLLHVNMHNDTNCVIFTANTRYNTPLKHTNVNVNSTILPIDNLQITCNIVTAHKIKIVNVITFNTSFEIPGFVEKMSVQIFNKIFLRIKQFIENYTNNV